MGNTGFTAEEKMQIILLVILLFAGYLAVLRRIQSAAEDRDLRGVALILLAVFACGGFGLVYAAGILGGVGNMLLAVLLGLAVFSVAWLGRNLSAEFADVNKSAFVLFLGYTLAILCATVFFRTGNSDTTIQTSAFSAVKSAAEGNGTSMLNHMILNVLLFIPYGFLFAMMLPQKLRSILCGVMAGIVLSVFAETMQLVLKAGQCDLDDILANTFGTAAGYLAYTQFFSRWKPEDRDRND